MFFNLTWRNAKRSRSENLIYFLTMITAVAMFYIVLSLGQQDVIRFLSEIESDAVERLLTNLLPTVYLCALLFVFFLVVFANKYQLECRSRELGLYLMFGIVLCIRAVHSSGMKDGAHKYIVTGVQKNSGPKAVRFQAEGVDRESKAHDHNEKTEKRAMNKNSG